MDHTPLSSPDPWQIALAIVAWLLVFLAAGCGALAAAFSCLGEPLRRRERSGLIIDLIETGLKDGRRVEETVVSISASREASLGARFHLLAGYLEQGLPIRQALELVPRLLPVQVATMLNAGMAIGDPSKVFPACRQMLKDASSQSRSAVNYLLVLLLFTPLVCFMVTSVLQVFIFPKFGEVAGDMGASLPPVFEFITKQQTLFLILQSLLLLTWPFSMLCLHDSESDYRIRKLLRPLSHRILYLLPWRRKRMQRDFSSMLAILLDAGMPESEALELAGDCTANDIFRQRVARALAGLQQGLKLSQAVEMIDDSGEFRWRLTQAIGRQGGFVEAMAGWTEALDARAFQQEQATAQIATTALVLVNGVFVAIIAFSIFGVLISIINAGVLW